MYILNENFTLKENDDEKFFKILAEKKNNKR